MAKDNSEYMENKELIDAIDQIMNAMTKNEELMSIIGEDDFFEIQDAIAKYLAESEYDLTGLDDDDKNEIVKAVLIDYI